MKALRRFAAAALDLCVLWHPSFVEQTVRYVDQLRDFPDIVDVAIALE